MKDLGPGKANNLTMQQIAKARLGWEKKPKEEADKIAAEWYISKGVTIERALTFFLAKIISKIQLAIIVAELAQTDAHREAAKRIQIIDLYSEAVEARMTFTEKGRLIGNPRNPQDPIYNPERARIFDEIICEVLGYRQVTTKGGPMKLVPIVEEWEAKANESLKNPAHPYMAQRKPYPQQY